MMMLYDMQLRMYKALLFLRGRRPVSAKYLLGYSYLKKENYNQASNYFQQVAANISSQSSSMEQDAFVRSADSYFMNRDYSKANGMYSSVINNALPQSDYALFQQAMIAGIKSSAEKIRILNTLTRQYPASDLLPDVAMEIANTYMADEKFRDAIPYQIGRASCRERVYSSV